jgi:hypothetical protein
MPPNTFSFVPKPPSPFAWFRLNLLRRVALALLLVLVVAILEVAGLSLAAALFVDGYYLISLVVGVAATWIGVELGSISTDILRGKVVTNIN